MGMPFRGMPFMAVLFSDFAISEMAADFCMWSKNCLAIEVYSTWPAALISGVFAMTSLMFERRIKGISALLLVASAVVLFLARPSDAAIQCYDCHGTSATTDYRPDDAAYRNITTGAFKGNHRTHMSSAATATTCAACHGAGVAAYANSHRNANIDLSANINSSPSTGTYSKGTSFAQTATPTLGTCANVNCHFEATTPTWGVTAFAAPGDCNKCHEAPPATVDPGSHAKHNTYFSGTTNCIMCHSDHLNEAKPFAHATSAGKRNLVVQPRDPANVLGGSYGGAVNDYLPSQTNTFGNCTATYCHSPGNKASSFDAPNQTATWGGSLTCKGCHKADLASGSDIQTGSHRAHVNGFGIGYNTIKCVKCHASTAAANMTITSVSRHVNKQVELAFHNSSSAVSGSYNGQPATPASPSVKTPGSAYGQCQNVYCHSTAQGANGTWPPTYQSPMWGTAATGKCGTCHGVDSGQHSGMAIANVIATGSHTRHRSYTFGMSDVQTRCAACHSTAAGLTQTGCQSAVCHTNMAQKHSNYEVNIGIAAIFGASASYSGTTKPGDGYGSCTNAYCHSDGKGTPTYAPAVTWGGASLSCTSCHGSATASGAGGTALSGKHAAHVNNAAALGTYNSFHCVDCHMVTVSDDTTLNATTGTSKHVNKFVDYTGAKAGGPSRYNSSTKVCSNLYCHSSGQATPTYRTVAAWDSGTNYDCKACHGADSGFVSVAGEPNYTNTGAGTANANSHQQHVAGFGITGTTGCSICHYRTVDAAAANKLRNYSTLHLNRSRDIAIKLTGGKAGTYDSGNKTCASTYCHGTNPTPQWGITTIACNACHSARANDAYWASNSAHRQHWEDTTLPASYAAAPANAGTATAYRFTCASCHFGGQHVQGPVSVNNYVAQVQFGYTSAARKGNPYNYGTTQGTTDNGFQWTNGGGTSCSNTYCHSGGASQAPRVTSFNWASGDGTLDCSGCHGQTTYPSDFRKATPLYGSGTITHNGAAKRNAHDRHTKVGSLAGTYMQCHNCHAETTRDSTSIADKARHVNKAYNVSSIVQGVYSSAYPDGDNTLNSTKVTVSYSYNAGGSSCSNVSCHPVGVDVTTTPPTPKERSTSTVAWSTGYKCIDCHNIAMEDTGTFHHAMRNYSTGYPTAAPNGSAASGTNPANRRCTMCHVDHDKFSPGLNANSAGRAYNLRTDIAAAPTASTGFTNTDFIGSGTGGICISCHTSARIKDTTRRRNETGVTVTPVIAFASYSGSAHEYNVPAKFFSDGSQVQGNCSKCHNALAGETSVFMNITTSGGSTGLSFGNHNSGIRRLQGTLGAAGGETAEEQICYRCHSNTGDSSPGGGPSKAVANKDYYAAQTMNAASQGIYAIMKNAGYKTPDPNVSYTNKLYFKPNATETDYDGTAYPSNPQPSGHNTGDTFAGGSWIGRSMSPWEPSVNYETVSLLNLNSTNVKYWRMATFVSPPVQTTTTVPAGSWIINVYCRESSTSLNGRVRYMVYKWDAGGMGATIIVKGTYATELSTTAAPGVTRSIAVNVGSVTLNAGEKIVADISLETNQSSTYNRDAFFNFGSGAPSNLTLPGMVYWSYGDPGTTGFGHNASLYAGVHKPSTTDETQAFLSANKHVECVDCHNPHATKAGLHTANNSTIARVLREVPGVTPTFSGTNWAGATGYTPMATSDKEYKICFKCHSNANTNVTSWSTTGSPAPTGSKAWTNLALEFNPANKSGHPVVATLSASAGRANAKALGAAALKAPWNASPGNNIMTCSDCHGSDSATTKGPHGSSVKWMLTGTNKAWPFTLASQNGGSTGTTFKLGTYSLNNGTSDGLFCLNCHTVMGATKNRFHANVGGGQHSSWASATRGACVSCHIRVPHGGKVSRLIRPGTAAVLGRYAPDGNGAEVAGQSQQVMTSFDKPATWGTGGTSYLGGSGSCGCHSGGAETW